MISHDRSHRDRMVGISSHSLKTVLRKKMRLGVGEVTSPNLEGNLREMGKLR